MKDSDCFGIYLGVGVLIGLCLSIVVTKYNLRHPPQPTYGYTYTIDSNGEHCYESGFTFKEYLDFLTALTIVESNQNVDAVGDNGNAVGVLQIWKIYVDDVNRLYHHDFTYEDRKDYAHSIMIAEMYMHHYAKIYYATAGNDMNVHPFEVMARIHNGGPNGYKKDCTKPYWEEVKAVLYNSTDVKGM